ncbi:RELA/SPOT homolog 1 [Striga asiatica]|uniref:RELA/SPOT homolog 1 n=1 Tax=Striga asiatica TaxID=4170 RepID=A0A5A7Q6G3_STRAF|nr:RELA/SPOT homolog 1 [Striga asiatica]
MADRSFIIRVEFDKFPITILSPAMAAYLRMMGVVQLRLHNDKGNTWIVVAGLNAGSAIFQEVNEGDTIVFDHVGLHIFNVFIFDDKGNIKSAPAKGDLHPYAAMTNNDDVQQMAAVFRGPGWSEQDVLVCYKLFFEKALALNEIHRPSTPLARDLSQLLGRYVENRAVREQIQRLRNHYNIFRKFLQRTRSKFHSESGEVRVNNFYWLYVWPEENPIERFHRTTNFKWHDECMLVIEMREAAKICFNDSSRNGSPDYPPRRS